MAVSHAVLLSFGRVSLKQLGDCFVEVIDTLAVSHPNSWIGIGIDFLQSLGRQLPVNGIRDALVPQTIRGVRTLLPSVGVVLGKIRLAVPIDVGFLRNGGNAS